MRSYLLPTSRRRAQRRAVRRRPTPTSRPYERSEAAELLGLLIVSLHQELEDWRAMRLYAGEQGWSPLALALIEIEIDALDRAIRESAGEIGRSGASINQ